ncbi:PREDICTED: indole-3-acetic acid-amido synthetase GH3.17-like [Tarenaya hassleriana]|uniref:indole-3-acetic acid-amido synthetase GH3.17-like n=1 Tax=Tarenaya hassleriana TaxID=28532 RepID=UPI00053C6500|nr:PREDICTED: indole-3-acetic acid-amido synthetase GH3.17-like [Tarenaya hassleriana]
MFQKFDPTNQEACLAVLEDVTADAKQIQESVLENIISRNAQTEYLGRFLNREIDKKSFKKNVPVIAYEDLRPYIDRIANGEPSDIICAQPITEFMSSSGTSGGVPKLIPMTAEDLDRRKYFGPLSSAVLGKHIEGHKQGKGLQFYFINRESETASGLIVRTMLTSVLKSVSAEHMKFWDRVNASPYVVTVCEDTKQSMYCQLLCGLVQRDHIVRLGAPFASSFLKVIKFLEDHWQELCSNIRTGHISEWITDIKCRTSTSNILGGPNLELADLIERECGKTSWEAIVRGLWPRAKCIEAIVTGSMAQYVPLLEFYGGGLPLVATFYGSSECFFGINFDPLCKPSDVSYTIIPNSAYFEFLEVDKTQKEGVVEVVDLVDVKIGHYYEPVVTTFAGLYRYRVGDVLRATGFHNNAPQFQVVGRQKVVLSIDMDKTYEEDLLKAMTQAKHKLEQHKLMLTDFTSYAETSSFPGHYVLYWELKTKLNDRKLELDPVVMEECCFIVEESLDAVYRKCRTNDKNIGPLEIKVVKQGTFDELMNLFVSRGSSVSQYKTPRSVVFEDALKVLDSGVLSEFFSSKTPSWELHELHSGQ